MKADGSHWRSLHNNTKKGWEDRAAFLNTRPVPGLLTIFMIEDFPGNAET